MDTKDKAKELMAKTQLGTVEIAKTLGVSPSLISQYKEDLGFMEEVRAMRVNSNMAAVIRDERLDALEDQAITSVEKSLVLVMKPMEAVRALQVINGLQRRSRIREQEPGAIGGEEGTTVSIRLPQHLKATSIEVGIRVNTNNEIVEVNGRHMSNMDSTRVLAEAQEQQSAKKVLSIPGVASK